MSRSSLARKSVRAAAILMVAAVLAALAACGGASDRAVGGKRSDSRSTEPTTSSTPTPTTALVDLTAQPCRGAAPPKQYEHVVVVVLENRTWSLVGGPGFSDMPYMRELSRMCSYYEQWDETNPGQNSLTQYIGITSGVDNPRTVADCSPSGSCYSNDDNIFRQVRIAGGTARNYVEGATAPCSAGDNAAKHIPALYYRGTYLDPSDLGTHSDADFCVDEVRPLSELDVNNLPTYAIITPSMCNDGHDCPNSAVDAYLQRQLGAILAGDSYRGGKTAIFVMYDEDRPTPNLQIAPSALPGPRPGVGTHDGALKTMLLMLGLPVLPVVENHQDLRASTPL